MWHKIPPLSEAARRLHALNMAKSVASSSAMSLLRPQTTRRCRCRMPCRRALRQRDGHHASVAVDVDGGSYCCGRCDATARRRP
eukprot:2713779-Pleurochrysis_carterae.AAC.1